MIRILRRQDWWLYLALFLIAGASLMTLASAAPHLLWIQFTWFGIASVLIFFLSQIDIRPLKNYKWIILGFYLIAVLLVLSTLIFAPVIRETQGWLAFGSIRFQPSELAKIALIIVFAYFFARRHIGIAHVSNLFVSFVYLAIPTAMVILQPDWGSALVLISLWIGFLLVSGIRWRHIIIGIVIGSILFGISWGFFLAGYQKERIIGFLKPDYDPLGVNYSVIQSKIAIGSGGLLGKGFGQGTQTQLGFLTEPATDFIFAAFTEEWGLVGATFIIGAFFLLIFRIIRIGLRSEDTFSQFICLGAVILFLMEFFLNIGSNLALFPVVGITFPFFSYGGSSLLTKALLIGIIQGIASRERF